MGKREYPAHRPPKVRRQGGSLIQAHPKDVAEKLELEEDERPAAIRYDPDTRTLEYEFE